MQRHAREVPRHPALVAEGPEERALAQMRDDPRGNATSDVDTSAREHAEGQVARRSSQSIHEGVERVPA